MGRKFLLFFWLCILTSRLLAADFYGNGPIPYNYHVVDGHILAGGHPFNPAKAFGNTDRQVRSILHYLKSQGVLTVVDLENTKRVQVRYQQLLDEAGLARLHIPLSSEKVPNRAEWAKIKAALQRPVYVHCAWGADRTGAVIARYLVEAKGYSPDEAYRAVINRGNCAGPLGGFKKIPSNRKLKDFIYHGPRR
jgi:hypothetical protein